MTLQVEGVVNGGMHAEKPLGGSRRFEPLQLAFAPSHRLMRILRSIVLAEPLLREDSPALIAGTPKRRSAACR